MLINIATAGCHRSSPPRSRSASARYASRTSCPARSAAGYPARLQVRPWRISKALLADMVALHHLHEYIFELIGAPAEIQHARLRLRSAPGATIAPRLRLYRSPSQSRLTLPSCPSVTCRLCTHVLGSHLRLHLRRDVRSAPGCNAGPSLPASSVAIGPRLTRLPLFRIATVSLTFCTSSRICVE